MHNPLKTTAPSPLLSRLETATCALVDLIDDALMEEVHPIDSIRLVMGFAKDNGLEELVFRRVMEESEPSYEVLLNMVAMTRSEQVYKELLAWADTRDEMDDLQAVYDSLVAYH
jgi:hypothetical protein